MYEGLSIFERDVSDAARYFMRGTDCSRAVLMLSLVIVSELRTFEGANRRKGSSSDPFFFSKFGDVSN